MAGKLLDCVEVETGADPTASVIWLHGLGADGYDFEPIVPQLDIPGLHIRFVFPHAPVRPVTLNAGFAMRAWYDIVGIDRTAPQDLAGIRLSQQDISALIEQENSRGISTSNIVLAGFSQGGALALYAGLRYPQKLAGLMGLSTYLPHWADTENERHEANQKTPVFLAHGSMDAVVMPALGQDTHALLKKLGYAVEWHSYPVAHGLCPEEVADIRQWLAKILQT